VSHEEPGSLSQWTLIRRRFEQHRLAVVSLYLLAVLYVMAVGAGIFRALPAAMARSVSRLLSATASAVFVGARLLRAGDVKQQDPLTLKKTYHEAASSRRAGNVTATRRDPRELTAAIDDAAQDVLAYLSGAEK